MQPQARPTLWADSGPYLHRLDKEENFNTISFTSQKLNDHEKNYSPFLLEAAGAVWGMDFFNKHLWDKQFILYTDHRPLEKLGHLHWADFKQLYWSNDFIIHFKKGSNMPADYFSRLPGAKEAVASIAAINPFQADLFHLHMQDEHIQMLQTYMTMNEWPTNLSRQDQTYFKNLAEKEKTRQEKGGLDQTHRFQLSPDCSVSSGMMQKRSHVWGSW